MLPDLPWFVYAMLLAPLGLLLVAAAYKSLQVRAAREWPSTAGRVVVSKTELRKTKVIDGDRAEGHRFEERNFADIVYEYSVAGRKLRSNRVSIGEDRGNFQVAETIAKYPVGAVVTVYYNPLHPDQAVLERDLPKGMWGFRGGCGLRRFRHGGGAVRAGPAPAGVVGEEVAGSIRHDKTVRHRAVPSRADGWIVARPDHQRRVSYTYKYNNLSYTNVHASLASNVASTSSWLVRKSTTDYQNGATVKVWVNPDNPAQATLEPRTGFLWVLWLAAAAIWGVAYYAAVHG